MQLRGNSLGKESRFRELQHGDGVLAGNAREVGQEIVERITFFKVIDEGLHGHAGARKDGPPALGLPEIDDLVARIHERSRTDGLAVAHFYADMNAAFREWRRLLKPGGRLALYMGDSQAQGFPIRASENLARLAVRAGFTLLVHLNRPVPEKVASTIRRIDEEQVLLFE